MFWGGCIQCLDFPPLVTDAGGGVRSVHLVCECDSVCKAVSLIKSPVRVKMRCQVFSLCLFATVCLVCVGVNVYEEQAVIQAVKTWCCFIHIMGGFLTRGSRAFRHYGVI